MAMTLLAMTMENVAAKHMLVVTSVTHVLLVTTTSQLAQVSDANLSRWHKINNNIFSFLACACDTQGTDGNDVTCNDNGECSCKAHVGGDKCDTCSPGYYNFPACTGK